jgi:hypothetical protein
MKPLNLMVLLTSIFFLHIQTDFYEKFGKQIPKLLLILYDVICHWGPFIYTLNKKTDKDIDWFMVFLVLVIYFIFALDQLNNIYFNIEKYYSL